MNKTRGKCTIIRDMMIRSETEEPDEQDKKFITAHLQKCADCSEYKQHLLNISKSMDVSLEDNLQPDPRIHSKLVRQLKGGKQKAVNPGHSAWNRLIKILEYRIPLYQAVLTLFLILVLVFSFYPFIFSGVDKHPNLVHQTENDSLALYQVDVYRNLQTRGDAYYGRNLLEDSMLTRYMSSSL